MPGYGLQAKPFLGTCSTFGTQLATRHSKGSQGSLRGGNSPFVKSDVIDLNTTCLIIGGGPAGYGAAVAALREGCDTIVVDRHGFLGGMGTAAGLSCYINYSNDSANLADSVYRRLIDSLARDGQHYYDPLAQADFFEPEACKLNMETTLL